MASICENCGKNEASTKCDVCGSMVCQTCTLEYGCKACKGGKQSF